MRIKRSTDGAERTTIATIAISFAVMEVASDLF